MVMIIRVQNLIMCRKSYQARDCCPQKGLPARLALSWHLGTWIWEGVPPPPVLMKQLVVPKLFILPSQKIWNSGMCQAQGAYVARYQKNLWALSL